MSYGIKILDGAGAEILHIDDRVMINIGKFYIPSGDGIVNIPVPDIADDGTWAVVRFGVGIEFTITPGNVACNRLFNFLPLGGTNVAAGNGIAYEFQDYFRVYRW